MNKSSNFCPVPKEQQPVEEYRALQDSWFFSWAKIPNDRYLRKLGWIWVVSWLICGPVAAASFSPTEVPIVFFAAASGGCLLFVLLAVTRLYLGWNYIRSRLNSETIFYEETGWYDGQNWTKTPEMLARDRLLISYELAPIFQRLNATTIGTISGIVAIVAIVAIGNG
jgi:hypothetical protein